LKIVFRPGKQGQKPNTLTRMPGDISPKGGAEKSQQIEFKTVNLDKRIQKELVTAIAKVVNLGEEEVNPEKLWNWIKNVCKDCPPDSSAGLYINTRETNNKDNLFELK
jgi:hypothetical protein